MKEIPVLLYHNIGNYPENMMEDGMLPQTFEKQMKFLSQNGFNIVDLNQAVKHLQKEIKLPPQSISVTIDGGYRDAITNVLPVLERYGIKATFFISPEYIDNEQTIKGEKISCLSWIDVHKIVGSGIEVGLLAYKGMSIRQKYDEESVKDSIKNELRMINEKLKIKTRYCAFKEGVPSKSLWEFIQSQGFEAVFTQCPTNRKAAVDGIGRIQIDDDDHNIFMTKISKTYLFFKDKRSWKYLRKFKIGRVAHTISETWNWIKGE
jgi:peptidoglycan/xylan/chitin deacetylase (PgdA/CDA1 family)